MSDINRSEQDTILMRSVAVKKVRKPKRSTGFTSVPRERYFFEILQKFSAETVDTSTSSLREQLRRVYALKLANYTKMLPASMPNPVILASEASEEDKMLLNTLYQSLQNINESMSRSNMALSELVEEVKLLRKSE